MTTSHQHDTDPATPATIRFALWILVPTALAAAIGMVTLWPAPVETPETDHATVEVTGTVEGIAKRSCPDIDTDLPGVGEPPPYCGTTTVRITSGDDTDQLFVVPLPTGPGAPVVDLGDDIVLLALAEPSGGQYSYHIIDHDRSTPLWIIAAAFMIAVVAFGRWRGLAALGGLVVTFAVLLIFIIPAILGGEPPLLVAIVGSAVIMLTVLYLTHGFGAGTTIAVIGTLAALLACGLLSMLAVDLAHLTGVADEDTTTLAAFHGVNMRGLLLAGILIGSLGALDDVTVTQAAAVTELARANPGWRPRQLYAAAARIGRAHIASVVNTIILAYAGASLPVLILLAAADRPLGEVITAPLLAQEVVRGVVGTIGLILAVPLTTALAALTVRRSGAAAIGSGGTESTAADRDGATPEPPPPGPRPAPDRKAWLEMHDDRPAGDRGAGARRFGSDA